MRYNPALDGLRAVAITGVMIYHSFHPSFAGGWLGVDVFFTLSGFLITSILLREIERTGSINWGNFYWRRFLRLSPALAILMIFELFHAALSPRGAREILESMAISVPYLENFNTAYVSWPQDYLGHTWSLATEEQFYLIWPLILPFVIQRRPIVSLVSAATILFVGRFALWHFGASANHLSFGPDTRPIGLLIGCGLAFVPKLPTMPRWASWGFLGLIGAAFLAGSNGPDWFSITAPLVASLSTAGIIIAAQQKNAPNILSWNPVVYIGRISYGLYLYSAPICLFGATKGINPFLLLILSFVAAAVSYELVEKPALRLKDRIGRGKSQGVCLRTDRRPQPDSA